MEYGLLTWEGYAKQKFNPVGKLMGVIDRLLGREL